MNKLTELKNTNNLLKKRINSFNDKLKSTNTSVSEGWDFSSFLIYHNSNNETSYDYLKILSNRKSKLMINDQFIRIICIYGQIKIIMPSLNEEITISPLNTHLIIPKTPYYIETLKNSELMCIYKPKKENTRYKIKEEKTIYNKI